MTESNLLTADASIEINQATLSRQRSAHPNKFRTYSNNPIDHPEDQIINLCRNIQQFGFTDPLIVDENMLILAGEGRLQAGKRLELTKIPYFILSGLTEEQKRAFRIGHNQIGFQSAFNLDKLCKEIAELQGSEHLVDISLTAFDINQIDAMMADWRLDDYLPPEDNGDQVGDDDSKANKQQTINAMHGDGTQGGTGGGQTTSLHSSNKPVNAFGTAQIEQLEQLTGYKTAMQRKESSAPVRFYDAQGFLQGDVLDYGCGYDNHPYNKFDPAQSPDYGLLAKHYDVVMINYVLNVVPLYHNKVELILAVRSMLKPDGFVLVACHRKDEVDTTSSSGYQCGWASDQWSNLFSKFYEVEQLQGDFIGFKLTPLSA